MIPDIKVLKCIKGGLMGNTKEYREESILNSCCEAWSYKRKKHKKIKVYRKSVQKETKVKRCLLILNNCSINRRAN